MMIEDIMLFLNKETPVHTNQQIIGFNVLFKGYVVQNWFGIESNNEFEDDNKILVKNYIQFYYQC